MKKYKFWLKSSRGTDKSAVVDLEDDLTTDEIEEILEQWCSGIPAWHVSGRCIRYGYELLTEITCAID